jgi:hypothetical protein
MARTFAEETVETSNTTGTGSYSLDGAKGDYLPFSSQYSSGDKPAYVVRNSNNTKWEMNRGAVFTPGSPATLARNVWKSTNSNAAVPWTVDDLPLTVYVPASAEVHEGVVTGWLSAARHALLRAGSAFWTYADVAVKWDRYIALGDATQTKVGTLDVVKGLWFDDGRRPWTAVGAASKTIAAADINGIFTQDNSAANRTFTLPAHGTAGIAEGFRVGGLGLTAGGQYGIALTPAAGDGIDGGADGTAKTIPGGVRFDVEWDEAGDTWRVSYLNTAQDWETGDYRVSLRPTTTHPGWVKANDGTLGNASSGATTRANADTADLYALLWNTFSDSLCPVSTGRGASATADFAANKTITLTKALGRALVVAGAGSGLTSRTLGDVAGTETHTHTGTTNSGGSPTSNVGGGGTDVAGQSHAHVFTTAAGSSMQPSAFVNVFIKL